MKTPDECHPATAEAVRRIEEAFGHLVAHLSQPGRVGDLPHDPKGLALP